MTDAPETIYLQWIPEGHPAADEITWCVDKIHENDTEYTRTDIAHPRIAEMESEIEEANNAIDDLVCLIAELEGEIVAWQKDVDNLELRLSNAVFDLGRST
jgi:predicted  nucleic acid-binding Zn-ribbon protein